MTQLVVNIENDSLIPSLKKILKSIAGVVSVQSMKEVPSVTMYDEESGKHLNDKSIRVITDMESGKGLSKEFDNISDFMEDLQA
ncbi:hypothetical protein PRBRB14_19370 [Hallella multisaccharivorax DSM 17128]|uniref:Uncharacterized protein n=1 Tax=Hallella multisaccharivorax DSM 17128 TaxID=688246 RepID=F8N8T5_9BACT|nr:hypothetical protein [Hallella multisaccharivorax]EGN57680.1 hypothetical protein Premu_2295 [Hallella multisaccharivorax DSM 17128]GJG31058.1 hypothetical protein PRBRB14_19370 [Hallella multisaccharivorax DSM 17128]